MTLVSHPYRGRLAPSPTGYLHLGHARTFWVAATRAAQKGGTLFLRNDDLDRARCRETFVTAMVEDLHWLGLCWEEPMITQSARLDHYERALVALQEKGYLYPCQRSRKDVAAAAGAPHEGDGNDEPVFPAEWRPALDAPQPRFTRDTPSNWRFRVPDGERIQFFDAALGLRSALAGVDFGDFLVWRKDGLPSYQLATVVDDLALGITEVVRGEDLIQSTFRQLLLFRALGADAPVFYHCPLVRDNAGVRLAKRHDALSLRQLRADGKTPDEILSTFSREIPLS